MSMARHMNIAGNSLIDDTHYSRTYGCRLRPLERHVERVRNKWLELHGATVIRDTDDRYLGLLDECDERTDTSAVTRRHAINLVHDQT